MKNKKLLKLCFVMLILFPLTNYSQIVPRSFEQLDNLQKTQNRFVVVFIYTDWCKYCQAMKNTTFKDKKIVELLNHDFWFFYLNAEEKKEINFNGYTFKFKPTGNTTGIHELAQQFTRINSVVNYPSLCILNDNYEIIFQYNQFLSSNDLQLLLNKLLEIS
tara:strand:+ start:156 stop:638 length:483 start_codon:yes stop_codon:yes gene_type:complete